MSESDTNLFASIATLTLDITTYILGWVLLTLASLVVCTCVLVKAIKYVNKRIKE